MRAPQTQVGRQAGLTMVEVMVSVMLVGIAAAFVFSIQVRTSQALRDQSAISEAQQTLRAASDVLMSDIRQAGYLAKATYLNDVNGNLVILSGITVNNSSTGPDEITLQFADTTFSAHITEKGPSHNSAETEVDNNAGFKDGDIVMALYTRPGDPLFGMGCVLAITSVQRIDRIQHNPGTGAPWNQGANDQCDAFDNVWNDYPYMIFVRVSIRKYRIKPNDPRGILQVSKSGGVRDDWVDIAGGIVDMQFAMKVLQPDDTTVVQDEDGDGDPTHDWFSGEGMETVQGANPKNQLLEMSMTLVAKTTKEVAGAVLDKTPDILEGTDAAHNRVGDHPGTTLPVSDKTSMYYGDVIYRTYTQTTDMRNLGVGYF